MVIKQTPTLGYHRIIVACENCRRRNVRCRVDEHDEHRRCENCLRLGKPCNFVRNPRALPSTSKRRKRPSIFDGYHLQRHFQNTISAPNSQPLEAATLEETYRTSSSGGPSAGISSKPTAQGLPVTSSSQAIRKATSGSILGSSSSLSSPAQGQKLPRLADFERFAHNGNAAFHFLEPQNSLHPTQYAICHCTKYFHHPQHEETHGTSSNCLGITNILSNRSEFLETPGPTTCGEGPSNGPCSFVYSTPWNMLSASSSFGGRQAEGNRL